MCNCKIDIILYIKNNSMFYKTECSSLYNISELFCLDYNQDLYNNMKHLNNCNNFKKLCLIIPFIKNLFKLKIDKTKLLTVNAYSESNIFFIISIIDILADFIDFLDNYLYDNIIIKYKMIIIITLYNFYMSNINCIKNNTIICYTIHNKLKDFLNDSNFKDYLIYNDIDYNLWLNNLI